MASPTSQGGSTGDSPAPATDPTDFANLVIRELSLTGDEAKGATGHRWLEQAPRSLFGIALSGGGIRSATFNLGLLQGLNEIGLLRGMDYLATVSGGGYTGGFWTRWRASRGNPGRAPNDRMFPDQRQFGLATSPANKDLRLGDEPAEIRHLRKFSRFLAPNVGVFTFDTGRMFVALVNAVVPSLIGAAAFLFIAMLLSIAIGGLVLAAPAPLADFSPRFEVRGFVHWGAAFVMLVFGALHMGAMSWFWKGEKHLTVRRVVVAFALLLVLAFIWGAMVAALTRNLSGPELALFWFGQAAKQLYPSATDRIWGYLLLPALALALVSVFNALFRPRSDEASTAPQNSGRAEADRVSSWLLFASSAWLGVVVLWWVAFFVAANAGSLGEAISTLTIAGIPAASAVAWLSRFVSRPTPSGEKPAQRAGRLSLVLVSYLALAALVVVTMLVIIWVHREQRWLALLGSTAVALLFTWWRYDPNRVGLHEFYRARIVRGFLGAGVLSGKESDDASEVQSLDDIAIGDLGIDRPVHLVVCAANDLTPKNPMTSLSRGAESAVLSPVGFSVGSSWTWWHTDPSDLATGAHAKYRYASLPTLGAALTASAAAFNTQMGAKSKSLGPAVAFLTTSLGLRLGLWLRHPAKLKPNDKVVREGAGWAFFAELLGRSDAHNDDWAFLSDGGHFDNTAFYELVRRHCRFIIVSDCGEDAERVFDDIGMAVRRVREDFDVDVRVNLEPLKPDASGCSRQPMVAGDIHYPDGDTGTILVFKPTIVGTEPPDVLQYRARNHQFPHQSTGDQFFDEAQWESYRRLGQHAARIAFSAITESERHPTLTSREKSIGDLASMEEVRDRMAREFSMARREWFARPLDYTQRVDRLARQVGALDQLLATSTTRLIREVNWELGPAPFTESDGGKKTPFALDDSAKAIGAVRQALVTFEAIFLSENLGTQFNLPMYLGVMNLMARWLRAPLVRAWWPLLRATCTQGFRTFVESQFELASARAMLFMPTKPMGRDVLTLASRLRAESGLIDGNFHLHLLLQLSDKSVMDDVMGLAPRTVEVARLDANTSDETTYPTSAGKSVMFWLARDLVVPPGLWGMGLGSALLARVGPDSDDTVQVSEDTRLARQRVQVVLVRTFRAGTSNAKKDSADLQQLYLQSDFEPITPVQLAALYPGSFESAYHALHARWGAVENVLPPPEEMVKIADTQYFVALWRKPG